MKLDICTCTHEVKGPCQPGEMNSRTVALDDILIRDNDWGGGLDKAIVAAAHTWYEFQFPGHSDNHCHAFNIDSHVGQTSTGTWVVLVTDPEGREWAFIAGPQDPANFPLDPEFLPADPES